MPAGVIGLGLRHRPGDPQTLELGHRPFVHEALVAGMCAVPGVAPHTVPGLLTSSSDGR
jgi:hypothetical protein